MKTDMMKYGRNSLSCIVEGNLHHILSTIVLLIRSLKKEIKNFWVNIKKILPLKTKKQNSRVQIEMHQDHK